MKKITLGILAHVDAGKTTLSEALLYSTGQIRSLGRVDHKNAHLDTHFIEKNRGITIFSKEAIIQSKNLTINLIDTPGHMDFSAEMERALSVLDYAILVISGIDGVQSHTETILTLLSRYSVPTFIFINKMDISPLEPQLILDQLDGITEGGCVDFADESLVYEEVASTLEEYMVEYLDTGSLSDKSIGKAVSQRTVYPVFFGSALKMEGVGELLKALERYTLEKTYPQTMGARVYKISFDTQGNRLTHLKITGGSIAVRDQIDDSGDKINQIRLYSGIKFTAVNHVEAGQVCVVTGLSSSQIGQGYGYEQGQVTPIIQPVLTYGVVLPIDVDPLMAYNQLKKLEEQDPQLRILWDSGIKEIKIQLMGEIQIEILTTIIKEQFGFPVAFQQAGILYKETIVEESYGAGHFEPLKHYAEVHLKLEPLPLGSGIQLRSSCSRDMLTEGQQNLILSHILEKSHTGVLTNSPITDMLITLTKGRGHLKHTTGGDFREATYRALRQGLLKGKSKLLEPYYSFKIELPTENLGRAINDITQMQGSYEIPESLGEVSTIKGKFPVSTGYNYQGQLMSYTKGRGKIAMTFGGYDVCHNSKEVIAEIGYDPASDGVNTGDSVFCSGGSGYTVSWDISDKHMHLDPLQGEIEVEAPQFFPPKVAVTDIDVSDEELMAIYQRTYGEIKREEPSQGRKIPPRPSINYSPSPKSRSGEEYLLVDGYNIIFAWQDLKELAKDNIHGARYRLMDILSNYAGYKRVKLILVFDAYKVKGGIGCTEKYNNIDIVYTKERETADKYIEKVTQKIAKNHKVTVATSDNLMQMIIWGHSAFRLSASDLYRQVKEAEGQIRDILARG